MPSVQVTYTAPPTVARFLDSNAFARVVVGPIGSGKSSGCIMEIVRRALEQAPGPDGIRHTRFAVIRNTYPELRDTTRKTFEQWVPPELGVWHKQEFSFRIRFDDVDCEVLFRALDRPDDVKKLLSLELTGAYFNELREIPKEIWDMTQGRVGRFPSKKDGGASWFGVWGDTNPYHEGHWLDELAEEAPEGFEMYRQPSGLSPEAENVENLPAGYYARLCAGKDAKWISVYVEGKDATGDEGSVFGDLLEAVKRRGGFDPFEHDTDQVHTHWDLGHGDATAIWFWRIGPYGVDVIDHYQSHGRALSHYFGVLDTWETEKGYSYVRHHLPHDARAKTLQTGMSVQELCQEHWGSHRVEVTPALAISDTITAARWLLEREGYGAVDEKLKGPLLRFHPRCRVQHDDRDIDGLKALRGYKWKWDDVRKVYSREPLHDWASHTSDAFRYLATDVREVALSVVRRAAAEKPKAPAARPVSYSVTLNQLWDTAPRRGGGRIG